MVEPLEAVDDGMIHLLGHSGDRQQPLDGRITELGLHQNIDPTAGQAEYAGSIPVIGSTK